MAEDWNFYFSRVDGNLASVFVDLSFGAEHVDPARPAAVWLSVEMRGPRADGLSDNSEVEQLFAIGDALDAVAKAQDALFVGRVTHAGLRDFYFYASPAAQGPLQEALNAAMAGFAPYHFESGVLEDPEWSVYRTFLFPDAFGMQQIRDNAVLNQLAINNDDPAKVRPVDFDFALPDAQAADALVAWAKAQGFRATGREVQAGGVVIYLQLDQTLLDIRADLNALYDKAWQLKGQVTGWGTIATP